MRAPGSEAEAPNPEAPKYKLGQLLSPEEQQQYQQRIDAALKRARESLRAAAAHLTSSQRQTYRRVENFIRQAEQLRQSDLVQAYSFAERADLLAQDLLRSSP